MEPNVSICCVTYNHEPYIRQCIEGFMMQKTNFPFEVLIHDDASIDGTQDIVREFEEKYPQLIKPIYQTENQYSKGIKVSPTFQFPRAKGKYIALCEGDDYWTDPQKLQKQVDFLERNPSYSLCFHNVLIDDTTGDYKGIKSYAEKNKLLGDYDKTFTIADTSRGGLIPTCSVVMRNTHIMQSLPPFFQRTITGDWLLWLLACGKKKMRYLSSPMAVYRMHSGGMSYAIRRDIQLLYLDRAEMLMDLDRYFKQELHDELSTSLIYYLSLLPFNESTYHIFNRFREYYPEMVFSVLEPVTKSACRAIRKQLTDTRNSINNIADAQYAIDDLLEWTNSSLIRVGFRHRDLPRLSQSYHHIALCFSSLHHYEKAIKTSKYFLKTCQSHNNIEAAQAHHDIASCYVRLKNYKEALNAFSCALEWNPTKLEIYLNKSDIYRYFNQYEESFNQINLLKNIAPMFPGLQETRSKIWKALYEQI